jgi:hypothetical protein
MGSENFDRQELERYAGVLADQADRLIRLLGVDVSGAETFSTHSPAFRRAADAYERLTLAQNMPDCVTWERATSDGRCGAEIMGRLWKVREELRSRDELIARQGK